MLEGISGSDLPLWGGILSWGKEGKDGKTSVKPPFSSSATRAEFCIGGVNSNLGVKIEKVSLSGEKVLASWRLAAISLNE